MSDGTGRGGGGAGCHGGGEGQEEGFICHETPFFFLTVPNVNAIRFCIVSFGFVLTKSDYFVTQLCNHTVSDMSNPVSVSWFQRLRSPTNSLAI